MKGRLLLLIILLMTRFGVIGEERDVDYRPNIHATLRTRLEVSTTTGDYRFQVRNARMTADGKIAPSVDYFLNTDLCDQGKMKILDAWVRIWGTKELGLQAGQFRMPFGTDPFRAPHTYIFANRSFIGKQVCNVRAVGAKAIYRVKGVPLSFEAGVFNPNTIGDHSAWHRKVAAAGRIDYRFKELAFSTGVQTIIPDSTRVNLIGGSITWTHRKWTVEGEYMNKHYTGRAKPTCHAYNLWADYAMEVKAGMFNRLSLQGRLDGMSKRNRITAGATLRHFAAKNRFLDLRANYEINFNRRGTAALTPDNGDKAVVELVLRF